MSHLSIIVTFAIVSIIFSIKARQLRFKGDINKMIMIIAFYVVFVLIACAAVVQKS